MKISKSSQSYSISFLSNSQIDWDKFINNIPKELIDEYHKEQETEEFKNYIILEDAFNNFYQFTFFNDINVIKNYIKAGSMLKLERYTGLPTSKLDEFHHGFASNFNNLVEKFYKENLTRNEFDGLMEEVSVLKKEAKYYYENLLHVS